MGLYDATQTSRTSPAFPAGPTNTPGDARTALHSSADRVLPASGTRGVLPPGGRSGACMRRSRSRCCPALRCLHVCCDCPSQCADSRVPATPHHEEGSAMGRVYENVSELVGRTPIVRLNRMTEGLGAQVVAKLEFYNPANSVKDRIGVAIIDAAERSGELTARGNHRRGHQRQYGYRVGDDRRGPWLQGDPHDAGHDVHRAPGDAARLRRRDRPHPGLRREWPARWQERSRSSRRPRTRLQPTSSPTPPTLRSTDSTTGEEVWDDTGGKVDISSPASAPAARSPGSGAVLRARKPGVKIIGVEPADSPILTGGDSRTAQDPGHRRQLHPRGARHGRSTTRSSMSSSTTPSRSRGHSPPGGHPRRHLRRRGRVGSTRTGEAPGECGQAHRRGHPRLR